jgi:hypothetical protein
MCEYKTLHLDSNLGYVLQCITCKHITIGFGILTFSQSLPEFYRFRQTARDCYAHQAASGADPKVRNIPFWQLSEHSCVTMSLNDLRYLCELLDFAYAKLELEKMISTLPAN